MERETFEDSATAALMNERFVCIKVDREERPDIDQVYMNAVQLITGQGGWPLNCFMLPDGKPVYGGTYFRNAQWRDVLVNLSDMFRNDPEKVNRYADQLTKGIRQSEWVESKHESEPMVLSELEAIYEPWRSHFDLEEGGMNRAPKFPLPNNWQFILRYGHALGNESALQQLRLTLDKMAYGGIYDHLGGGFARYSTDGLWKAPHFEKMLYDNAQLLELYAEAYLATQNPLYRRVVFETAAFVAKELTSPEGAFYSALDADSEGEEGKFYVWTKEELQALLGSRFPLFGEAYNVNSAGYWEEGNYILLRRKSDSVLAQAAGLSLETWSAQIDECKQLLLSERSKRIRPGLDDKTLVSWNALMIKAYVSAFLACDEISFLKAAERNAELLMNAGRQADGGLYHSYKAGRFTINGFLEDYAFTCEAMIALYQATFEEKWILIARDLAAYAIQHFRDPISGLFYFTSDNDAPLVTRKMEIMDNVCPSSNSSMAKALFAIGVIFGEDSYSDMSLQMLNQVKDEMTGYGSGYSNWAMLGLNFALPFHEIAICGPDSELLRKELSQHYLPNKLVAGGVVQSALPILDNRFDTGQTLLYVCKNRVCDLPVTTVGETLAQIQKG